MNHSQLIRVFIISSLLLSINLIMAQNAFPFNSVHGSTKEPLKIHVKNEIGEKSFLASHMPKGKIYLVSVWATWCGRCRIELKALQEVYCKWSEDYNFELLAISIDTPTDHPKVFDMAAKKRWDFKVLHDEYGYLVKELEVSALPRMFLVDQKGNIVHEPKGYSSGALKNLEERIKAL